METSFRALRIMRRRLLSVQAAAAPCPRPGVDQTLTSRPDQERLNPNLHPPQIPRLVFPGAGIFFYWQAGAVTYLREQGYNLSQVNVSGASAGAITATLATTDVDYYYATDIALQLGREAGVWDRPMGLMGIWGSLIHKWLDKILPDNAAEMANNRLSVLLTPFPSIFGKQRVTHFVDKEDLIRCNVASIHLPLFLDGRIASSYRDGLHIDGSFLSSPTDHFPDAKADSLNSLLVFDFQHDPVLKGKKKEAVKLFSEDGITSLFDRGREYAEMMDRQGYFEHLPPKKR